VAAHRLSLSRQRFNFALFPMRRFYRSAKGMAVAGNEAEQTCRVADLLRIDRRLYDFS
jgi:hypothetical protein